MEKSHPCNRIFIVCVVLTYTCVDFCQQFGVHALSSDSVSQEAEWSSYGDFYVKLYLTKTKPYVKSLNFTPLMIFEMRSGWSCQNISFILCVASMWSPVGSGLYSIGGRIKNLCLTLWGKCSGKVTSFFSLKKTLPVDGTMQWRHDIDFYHSVESSILFCSWITCLQFPKTLNSLFGVWKLSFFRINKLLRFGTFRL